MTCQLFTDRQTDVFASTSAILVTPIAKLELGARNNMQISR